MKTQPQSLEAEVQLLNVLLLDAPDLDELPLSEQENAKLDYQNLIRRVKSVLKPEDFFDKKNGAVYRAILELTEKGIIPNTINLSESLKKDGLSMYVFEFTADVNVILPKNAVSYAQVIRKASLERKRNAFIKQIYLINQECMDETEKISKTEELYEKIKKINKQIADLNFSSVIKSFDENDIIQPVLRAYGLLPEGYVSLLAGEAGLGKTYIALYLTFLWMLETRQPALVWLAEDIQQSAYRLDQMFDLFKQILLLNNTEKEAEEKIEFLKQNIRYVNDIADPIIFKDFGNLTVNYEMTSKLERFLQDFDFLLLDPLGIFYGQEENNNTSARFFMNTLQKLIFNTNKIILITHHVNKNKEFKISEENIEKNNIDIYALRKNIRGAAAFIDAPRASLFLLEAKKTGKTKHVARYMVNVKANMNRTGVINEDGKPYLWEIPFMKTKEQDNENKYTI